MSKKAEQKDVNKAEQEGANNAPGGPHRPLRRENAFYGIKQAYELYKSKFPEKDNPFLGLEKEGVDFVGVIDPELGDAGS